MKALIGLMLITMTGAGAGCATMKDAAKDSKLPACLARCAADCAAKSASDFVCKIVDGGEEK